MFLPTLVSAPASWGGAWLYNDILWLVVATAAVLATAWLVKPA